MIPNAIKDISSSTQFEGGQIVIRISTTTIKSFNIKNIIYYEKILIKRLLDFMMFYLRLVTATHLRIN